MELYQSMGFNENPFNKYSAEEELKYLSEMYQKPTYYESLLSEISEGNSRYLLGERGIGKSALMYYLISDLKKKQIFAILIDEFDGIPIKNNGCQILCLTEEKIITELGIDLLCDKSRLKRLDKYEREKLAFLINLFFESLGRSKFEKLYEKVSCTQRRNFFKKIYNKFVIRTINMILSGASNVIGSTICKSMGLPILENSTVYQEFLSESSVVSDQIDKNKIDYATMKNILKETAFIINKLGYKKLVVFFDKIDEYAKLKSNIDSIALFLENISTDTSLIYSDEFGIEFILWNKLKDKLKEKQVRFDKAKPIDISWTHEEIKSIINKRLQYFSDYKINSLREIVSEGLEDELIAMANGSPRQIIMLLSKIYEQQARIDSKARMFCLQAVNEGKNKYCQNFEYELFFPNSEIKQSVNRILKVNKLEFEISELARVTKKSVVTAGNWVRGMNGYGLVKEDDGRTGRAKVYIVSDPKLVYLITNGLEYIG